MEAGRDVCRDGTLFIPALKTIYMGGGTGHLPGRDIVYPGFKNCLYGRRDGMFAGTGHCLSRL